LRRWGAATFTEIIMAEFRRAAVAEYDPDSTAELVEDPDEALFEEEPDLERWRLLTEAIRLHRRAVEEPDGARRAQMLQEVIRLHSRWAQSQNGAVSRALDRRPKAW
jgi:hypothetical protein